MTFSKSAQSCRKLADGSGQVDVGDAGLPAKRSMAAPIFEGGSLGKAGVGSHGLWLDLPGPASSALGRKWAIHSGGIRLQAGPEDAAHTSRPLAFANAEGEKSRGQV